MRVNKKSYIAAKPATRPILRTNGKHSVVVGSVSAILSLHHHYPGPDKIPDDSNQGFNFTPSLALAAWPESTTSVCNYGGRHGSTEDC